MTITMKDLLMPLTVNYFTISYDLRVKDMDTKIDDPLIHDMLAMLLVRNKCSYIKCFVATTVHFSSAKSFDFWYKEISNYFGKFIVFALDQIKINEKGKPQLSLYENENYRESYADILEINYEKLITELREETDYELTKVLAAFLLMD